MVDWIFIVPLENVKLQAKFFKIGDVRLSVFNKRKMRKCVNVFRSILGPNPHYSAEEKEKFLNGIKKYNCEPNIGKTCAEVRIGGAIDKAHESALEKIRMALNVQRLYTYPNEFNFYKKYFGIVGEVIPSIVRSTVRYQEDFRKASPTLERVGFLYPFEIDSRRIRSMRKNGFKIIHKILKKKTPSEFEERLLAAISWFGTAFSIGGITARKRRILGGRRVLIRKKLEYFSANDRFLKLMISLESLFIFGRELVRSNIAERVAFTLAKSYGRRADIAKYMKKLYDIRSDIVHRGGAEVKKSDLDSLAIITQEAIIGWVLKGSRLKMKRKNDMFNWFEKQKIS